MPTVELTAQNFAETIRNGIVVVDAWADWCPGCREFGEVFAEAAERNPDATFATLDVTAEKDLMNRLEIKQLPTILAWRDGIRIFQKAGTPPGSALDQIVEQAAALDMDDVKTRHESDV